MMESSKEQLRQREERQAVERKEEERVIEAMRKKFKVRGHMMQGHDASFRNSAEGCGALRAC